MPDRANLATVAEATLCLLNGERADRGLAALRLNDRLQRAALGHGNDMVDHQYFAHAGRDGSQPADRIRATGYLSGGGAWRIGENLAWGTGELATPKAIMAAWMGSTGHRANILQPAYREIGFGVVAGNPASAQNGGATFVTEFGVIDRPGRTGSTRTTGTSARRAAAKAERRAVARKARSRARARRARARARAARPAPAPRSRPRRSRPHRRQRRVRARRPQLAAPRRAPRRTLGLEPAVSLAKESRMESSAQPARVLVVANRTAATPALISCVRERAQRGPCSFTLLVPNSSSGLERIADPEDHADTEAKATLELALPLLEEAAGSPVTGMVGDPAPLDAIQDAINLHGFDEIILSTLPSRVSRWLKLDLPSKLTGLGLPVTTVTPAGRQDPVTS